MNFLGHGIDICAISRIRAILGGGDSHFEKRVFSAEEIHYCRAKKDPMPHFAARFAAKEAYGKALGVGLGPAGDFAEIEVQHLASGQPRLVLKGKAREIFEKQGAKEVHLSLSHEGDMAIASVIILKA